LKERNSKHSPKSLSGHGNSFRVSLSWKPSDIRRPIQTFLLRAPQGSLKIGEFWERIQNYEQRAKCCVCNEATESLGHANLIWTNAKSIWPVIHLGTILGCESLSLPAPHQNGHPNPGRSRLLRLLLSESAHLIWVLRCERVIQETNHSVDSTINRWTNKINHRLTLVGSLKLSGTEGHSPKNSPRTLGPPHSFRPPWTYHKTGLPSLMFQRVSSRRDPLLTGTSGGAWIPTLPHSLE
jgi:hypothetical protein